MNSEISINYPLNIRFCLHQLFMPWNYPVHKTSQTSKKAGCILAMPVNLKLSNTGITLLLHADALFFWPRCKPGFEEIPQVFNSACEAEISESGLGRCDLSHFV